MRVTKARCCARLLVVTAFAWAAQENLRVASREVRVEIDGGFQDKPDNEQILIAEVVDGGSKNGTLIATYKSDFPGDYLVYIDEVEPADKDTNDIADTFWRPGTWLSSNVASAAHGVMRNGWVFQPKSCVFDTFSYEDLMLLASLDNESTWLLVLGGSVQRGVFLTLIDMVLAEGQKHDISSSVLQKCWGYADVQVGNLRLTYQGWYWMEENPTMTALKDVGIRSGGRWPDDDNGLGEMDGYQTRDSRVSFLSVFPMFQAKLFENQESRNGIRRFAGSQHFHYVSADSSARETRNGTIMVHSTITEMLANIMVGRAVETKAKLNAKAAASTDDIRTMSTEVGKVLQVCSDCPSGLLPFHVKSIPEPVCEVVESLPEHTEKGEVWSGDLCPEWCMKQAPVSQTMTESDVVNVRECSENTGQP
ncbi:unnamed protein product [Ectocarpus sp. 13 AM-2016]